MIQWLKSIFFRKPNLVYPLKPVTDKMREKDPELWEEVKWMGIASGIARWVEVHPEDFPLRGLDAPTPDCIK